MADRNTYNQGLRVRHYGLQAWTKDIDCTKYEYGELIHDDLLCLY